jgi:hypothetical protein
MKLPKLKYTLLATACLSGLVSCYPVDPMNPYGRPGYRPSGLKTQAELDAAALQRANEANSGANALELANERLEREERERLEAERREAAGYREALGNNADNANNAIREVKPAVVKFAAPVPNKAGFVYNPYTNNQVDVRGIPSGTKVRDPHDTNPAHVFRVP